MRSTNSWPRPCSSSRRGCAPSSASITISSARSRPTPSTSSAAARSTCEGSDRFTSSFVPVTGAAAAAAGAAPALHRARRRGALAHQAVRGVHGDHLAVAQARRVRRRCRRGRGCRARATRSPRGRSCRPESVTIAAAFRISGTQSGAVMCVTRTSPSSSASRRRASSRITPHRAAGEAGRCAQARDQLGARCTWPSVLLSPPAEVTGRDCSIQALPSGSKAHSVSCGAP